jgi:hypothetical protein
MTTRNYGRALFKHYSAHANPDGQAPDVYRDTGPIAELVRGHWDAVGSHVAATVEQAVSEAAGRIELDDFARLTKAERTRLVAAVMAELDRGLR